MATLGTLHEHLDVRIGDDGLKSLLAAMGSPEEPSREKAQHLRDQAEYARRRRRAQRRIFPEAVLRGPCWDIMLDCLAGELAGRPICVKQIRTALQESQTSVLRRIDELERAGMVRRSRDEMDGRRTLVRLTEDGARAMARFFSQIDDPATDPQP